MTKNIFVLFVALGFHSTVTAQENSPYSRYGLGDLAPNRNILSRSMGGIAAGISNSRYLREVQSINFTNPASQASVSNTIFDVGTDIAYRTLKSTNPASKFTSANAYFSYLQLAFPVTPKKWIKKDMNLALSIGLKPVTKINYKIESFKRLSGIDSLNTLYEGNGGLNQAHIGTGLRYKNLSMGINIGYMFGSKEYSTKLEFINDTVLYYMSNSANKTNIGGLLINAGIQYETVLNKDQPKEIPKVLRFGVYGNVQQKLNGSSDDIRETFSYDGNGGIYRLDSVYENLNVKGDVVYPATLGAGFSYQGQNWLYGADFEMTSWDNYRYYGNKDLVQSNWILRGGVQYFPAKQNTSTNKYFQFVKYRAGFYFGNDYIKVTKNRPDYAFTVGAGMPLTSLKRISYTGEYVMLNTALEIGNRGNKQTNIRENVVRFSVGISMNARWFQKPKYN